MNSVCLLNILINSLPHNWSLQTILRRLGICQSIVFKFDNISVQYHNGHLCHFFPCAALKCKAGVRGVHRYQDSKDKASTANLKHYAIQCFGLEAVCNKINGKAGVTQSASIFSLFAHQGQAPVQYSHRSHTNMEVQ